MLNSLRIRVPDLDEARDIATDRVTKAADIATQAAKDASDYLEEWAKDGLESVRSRPLAWSAASLGLGMLIGGLFAVWTRIQSNGRHPARTMPARSRPKKMLHAARKAQTRHRRAAVTSDI